jgi:GH35 family endo-1,4-beta-xylanase
MHSNHFLPISIFDAVKYVHKITSNELPKWLVLTASSDEYFFELAGQIINIVGSREQHFQKRQSTYVCMYYIIF